ncbi:MAG: thioesterase family protein [Ignisphaera sp.]
MYQDIDFSSIPIGIKCVESYRVGDGDIAKHVGSLSTPSMILFMEMTAMRCVEKYLPLGYTTVGYSVNVRHVSPAPPGATVWVEAVLISRDNRKLVFSVKAFVGERLIGEGLHERYIVSVERFLDKIRRSLSS